MNTKKLINIILLALTLAALGFSQPATARGYYRGGFGHSHFGHRGGHHLRHGFHGGYTPFRAYHGPRYFSRHYRRPYYGSPPYYGNHYYGPLHSYHGSRRYYR